MARIRNAVLHYSPVTAEGSLQTDATPITTKSFGMVGVSGANAAKGVLLPPAAVGKFYIVLNLDNAVLKVWPASGDAINVIAPDAAISLAAYASAIFTAKDSTTWITTPRVPS